MENEVTPYLLPAIPLAIAILWAVDSFGFRPETRRRAEPRWTEGQGLIAFAFWFLCQILFAALWPTLGVDAKSAAVQFLSLLGVTVTVAAFAFVVTRSVRQDSVALACVLGPLRNYAFLPIILLPVLILLQALALWWHFWLETAGIAIEEQALIEQFRVWVRDGKDWEITFFMVNAIVLAPIGEEIVFRGLLFRALASRRGFWVGAVLSSVFFGVVHWVPAGMVPLAFVGLVLCYLLWRTGSLFVAIAFHALFNATTVLVVWLQASGVGS